MPTPVFSIVIPAYNEERCLAATLSAVLAYLQRQSYSSEVILSDDGSTDSTAAIAEDLARSHPELRVLRHEHRGKGYAVRAGIQAAHGEIVLFSDADLSTPIEELDRFIPCFESGCEVVIGSRQGEGMVLLDTTFSNNPKVAAEGSTQDYPRPGSAPHSGAVSSGTLGYSAYFADSVYHFSFTFAHAEEVVVLEFASSLFEGKGTEDESWGLGRVRVEAVGE